MPQTGASLNRIGTRAESDALTLNAKQAGTLFYVTDEGVMERWSGSAWAQVAGVPVYTVATVPGPSGLADGQLIRLSDVRGGMDFRYDLTNDQWLSDQLFTLSASTISTTINATFNTGLPPASSLDIWVEEVSTGAYVTTTNTGSHYWTLSCAKWTGGAWVTVASVNTSAVAANVYNDVSGGTPVSVAMPVGTMSIQVAKTGTPGTLIAGCSFHYRLQVPGAV